MRESGNRRAPTDVLAFLNIPTRWHRRVRVHSARLRSAELRPVGCCHIDGVEDSEKKRCAFHIAAEDVRNVVSRFQVVLRSCGPTPYPSQEGNLTDPSLVRWITVLLLRASSGRKRFCWR